MKKKFLLLALLAASAMTFMACSATEYVEDDEEIVGNDWHTWMSYVPCDASIDGKAVKLLVGIDDNSFDVFYDQDEQVLVGATDKSVTYEDFNNTPNLLYFSDIDNDGTSELIVPDNRKDGTYYMVFTYNHKDKFEFNESASSYNMPSGK